VSRHVIYLFTLCLFFAVCVLAVLVQKGQVVSETCVLYGIGTFPLMGNVCVCVAR